MERGRRGLGWDARPGLRTAPHGQPKGRLAATPWEAPEGAAPEPKERAFACLGWVAVVSVSSDSPGRALQRGPIFWSLHARNSHAFLAGGRGPRGDHRCAADDRGVTGGVSAVEDTRRRYHFRKSIESGVLLVQFEPSFGQLLSLVPVHTRRDRTQRHVRACKWSNAAPGGDPRSKTLPGVPARDSLPNSAPSVVGGLGSHRPRHMVPWR